jgi:ferritin-like metal-binding protein YciE
MEDAMGLLMNERFNSLADLFMHELRDIYDAEHRILETLPQMADKASNPQLKQAINTHRQQTEKQIQRLESVFEHRGVEADRKKCDAIVGIISEGSDILSAEGDADSIDAALIASGQKVEHYEIASYGTLRTFARQLNDEYSAELLEQTLEEEKETDVQLTRIAEGAVNPASA